MVFDMLFENAFTWTQQGNIGEARAIYEYTRLGYSVAKPLHDNDKYDLIIDDGESLKRVQVKTTKCEHKENTGRVRTGYQVNLVTKGGNTRTNNRRNRKHNDYDILFVLAEDGRCWSIPVEALGAATSSISVGAKGEGAKYTEYEL